MVAAAVKAKKSKAPAFEVKGWAMHEWKWPWENDVPEQVVFEFPAQFADLTLQEIRERHGLEPEHNLLPLNHPLAEGSGHATGDSADTLRGKVWVDVTVICLDPAPAWKEKALACFTQWNYGTVMAAHRKWNTHGPNRQGIDKVALRNLDGSTINIMKAMKVEREKMVAAGQLTAQEAADLDLKQKARGAGRPPTGRKSAATKEAETLQKQLETYSSLESVQQPGEASTKGKGKAAAGEQRCR